MEAKPKLTIRPTAFDKVLVAGGIILLVMIWIISVINYAISPEVVPIHFNLSGEPDGYGSKLTLLLLPIIPSLIYFGLTQLNKRPYLFNYPVKITNENAAIQYTIATRMIRLLNVSVALIFLIDVISTFLITVGIFTGLGWWSFPLTLLLVAAPTIYSIITAWHKNRKAA